MHWTEILERRAGDVVILELRGQLTLAEPENRLMARIAALLNDGTRRIVLNLRHSEHIDSTGIGEIAGAYTRVMRKNGALTLCEASARVREVLQATNLDTVLRMVDTENEAIRTVAASGG